MFRSALLALKPSITQRYVVDAAVTLAQSNQWNLAACTVVDSSREAPAEAVPLGAAAFKRHHDEQLLEQARQTASESTQVFTEACQKNGVASCAAVVDGSTVEVLVRQSAEHDLLLVGHSLGDDTGDESILHQILKHSSRPAIVFPKQAVPQGNLVIAYDGSHQAARTLASLVYSGVARNRKLHVVSFHDTQQRAINLAEEAGRFLKHHGIEAHAHGETTSGSIPEMLRDKAVQYSAGMLVMGAFGKSTVREFLFGSVTRQILHTLSIPLFLNH